MLSSKTQQQKSKSVWEFPETINYKIQNISGVLENWFARMEALNFL